MTGYPEQFRRCECRRKELRRRTYSNGTVAVCEQCLDCGRQVSTVARRNVNCTIARLPEWDDSLVARRNEQMREFYDQQRSARNAEWWARYEAHLASPEWQDLRQRVMERCRGLCEGCRLRRAVQVHHLTYERLGNEMLFDLAAVCLICHAMIHGRPIGEEADGVF